jgi:putative transposase
MITDKLGSYAAARRQIMPAIEHRSHKGLNNRAENSHLPLRRRERAMQGFRFPAGPQRFVAVFFSNRDFV